MERNSTTSFFSLLCENIEALLLLLHWPRNACAMQVAATCGRPTVRSSQTGRESAYCEIRTPVLPACVQWPIDAFAPRHMRGPDFLWLQRDSLRKDTLPVDAPKHPPVDTRTGCARELRGSLSVD